MRNYNYAWNRTINLEELIRIKSRTGCENNKVIVDEKVRAVSIHLQKHKANQLSPTVAFYLHLTMIDYKIDNNIRFHRRLKGWGGNGGKQIIGYSKVSRSKSWKLLSYFRRSVRSN
ncbi:MAG: hypothetical protein IPI15_16565 [Saprospiraceae bacterium]|uniref:hypothetical protein n=1 Tax=Candidatus Brachybacter algidus TaxID=2982024 RepID=UPI00257DEFB7|nr:hypothetical protein [Candidatus Brachybacter algidus]MBK7605156.1 hypothetical protein [Candidatus Brachybacter algidus]